ncbi:hypothetical protein [Actinomadura geliboluensis]|uniref:Uncharacterized protein n=1 Tax=Actinomadura geliboluensis TaxID=882440 RepID=A0A5S4H9U5_9ACTN|nr:hypothetical protein [Actinomadura geliboluensis]TMR41514.1 hypothetical protein ETD96_05190 [Actinomadura geliboluensis]
MSDVPPDLPDRLAAYQALMDAIVPESAYWAGEREDAERVAFLADAVADPAAARRRAESGDEQGE